MWFVSLPIAVGMIWFAWHSFAPHARGASTLFLIVWTAGIVVIEGINFRTMYLGRGRRAQAVYAALDRQNAEKTDIGQ